MNNKKILIVLSFFASLSFGQHIPENYNTSWLTGTKVIADLASTEASSINNRINQKHAKFGNNLSISSIDSLENHIDPSVNTVIVTDSLQGGIFSRVTYGVVDNGTIFPDNVVVGNRFSRQYSGDLKAEWYGIIGNGKTINTTTFQNALNMANSLKKTLLFRPGIFLTGSLVLSNNISLCGAGNKTIILKAPSLSTAYLFRDLYTTKLTNLSFKNICFDGNVIYFNHMIDPSSPIKDTTKGLFDLSNSDNVSFSNVKFIGSEGGIFCYHNHNLSITKCLIENIGGMFLNTNYSTDIIGTYILNNKFISYGCRDSWDPSFGNVRFGQDALVASGDNFYCENNLFFNGACTKWFVIEGRFGSNVNVNNNIFDANGLTASCLSIGGYLGTIINGLNINNNKFINNNYNDNPPVKPIDFLNGRVKFMNLNYTEIGANNMKMTGNNFGNMSFGINNLYNSTIENNTFIDSAQIYGYMFSFNNESESHLDSCSNVNFSHNIIKRLDNGPLIDFAGSINKLRFDHNVIKILAPATNIMKFRKIHPLSTQQGVSFSFNEITGQVYCLATSIDSNFLSCTIQGNNFNGLKLAQSNINDSKLKKSFHIINNTFNH